VKIEFGFGPWRCRRLPFPAVSFAEASVSPFPPIEVRRSSRRFNFRFQK
jgi:hypothetical protein